jgi:hypothetical protein
MQHLSPATFAFVMWPLSSPAAGNHRLELRNLLNQHSLVVQLESITSLALLNVIASLRSMALLSFVGP